MTCERLGAMAGLTFGALLLVGWRWGVRLRPGPTRPSPGSKSPASSWSTETTCCGVIYSSLVAVFFLLWFVTYLRHRLQAAEGEEGWLASVAYGGGLVSAALMLVASALELASTVVAQHGGHLAAAKTLFTIGWDYYGVLGGPPMG